MAVNRTGLPFAPQVRIVEDFSKAEMVVAFLRAETDSSRCRHMLDRELTRLGMDRVLIEEPNVLDRDENIRRETLLLAVSPHDGLVPLLPGLPDDIEWKVALPDIADLKRSKYVKIDHWVEFSGPSRQVADGARAARDGKSVSNIPNELFLSMAAQWKAGSRFPRPILVAENAESDPVILDGHLRITSLALLHLIAPRAIPQPSEVIIGFSRHLPQWPLY